MREQVTVGASVGKGWIGDWRATIQSLLAPLIAYKVIEYPYGYEFSFNYYPTQVMEIVDRLKEQNIHATVRVSRRYSKRELMQAEFLHIDTTQELNATRGILRKTCRLLCPHCGFEEPIYDFNDWEITRQPTRNQFVLADSSIRIVSQTLAIALSEANITGLRLTPVGGAKQWWNIDSDHILPPLTIPPTRVRWTNQHTTRCLPNHAFYSSPDSQMFYTKNNFDARELNVTNEYYGGNCHGGRALIVSNRVYQMFVKLGVQGYRCEPIEFIE